MKVFLGWLGDPYLHLFGIVALVVALGARLGSDPAGVDSADAGRCTACRRFHESSGPCALAISARRPPVQVR